MDGTNSNPSIGAPVSESTSRLADANRTTRQLLQQPVSGDGGRHAKAAFTDVRLNQTASAGTFQPKALRQGNDFWQWLEKSMPPEHEVLWQLGFTAQYPQAPPGMHHYIEAFAYADDGSGWRPPHYWTDVEYPEDDVDQYRMDPYAKQCFLPPPRT